MPSCNCSCPTTCFINNGRCLLFVTGPEELLLSEPFRGKVVQWLKDKADMIPGMMCYSFCGKPGFGGPTLREACFLS
jgi:hypothetical protein